MKLDKSGVTSHPKYGLNPSLSACILCGDPTGNIVFFGNSIDEESPKLLITTIEPCEECRDKYLRDGTLLVEAENSDSVTGRSLVIKDSAYSEMFETPIPENKIALVAPAVYTPLLEAGKPPAPADNNEKLGESVI
jgi:hypothetical protein